MWRILQDTTANWQEAQCIRCLVHGQVEAAIRPFSEQPPLCARQLEASLRLLLMQYRVGVHMQPGATQEGQTQEELGVGHERQKVRHKRIAAFDTQCLQSIIVTRKVRRLAERGR